MTRLNSMGKFVGGGTTPRHTRPRSGIQVSVANAVGFKKCGGLKARGLWIPNQVGDDDGG
jgi:hypothetical protein